MDKQQALTLLGLNEQYSAADLTNAVVAKKQLLQQKREAAPTEILKAKFDMMLLQLNEAETLLQAASTASPQAKASSPLSHTKLADLPSMAPGDAEQLTLQPGQILAGRYKIEELLGQGGMGAVYRAHDSNRDEDIAIKLLLPSLAKNDRARERFMNEARLSSRLSHPNIVNVFDVQKDGDLVFLTMELLEGQDLRALMDSNRAAGQQFLIDDVKDIVEAMSQALGNAHETTVHRDIKPENIWFGTDGKIKLMDFGIAQVQSTSQRTKTGAAMGTAYYMAPEQLKGLSDIDGRADQYAVAVMAYELLTGEVPAGAIEPVRDLRKDVPPAMAAAIMQALSPRPENRFADMAAFNAAFQSGKAPKASKTKSTSYSSSNASAKWPMVAGVIAVLVVGGGLLGTGVLDVSKLMPVSKELVAAQKAQVAKVQGEIKVYKQRLENGRRQLDSDVRDAERNKSAELARLKHWQDLTENAIFAGSQITELEGELSMAETLLRENAFELAQASMDKVSVGYKGLWDNFTAAEQVYVEEQEASQVKSKWLKRSKEYNLRADTHTQLAEAAIQSARTFALAGDFVSTKQNWQNAQHHWQAAFDSVGGQVAQIDKQRAEKVAAKNRELAAQAAAEGKLRERALANCNAAKSQLAEMKDKLENFSDSSERRCRWEKESYFEAKRLCEKRKRDGSDSCSYSGNSITWSSVSSLRDHWNECTDNAERDDDKKKELIKSQITTFQNSATTACSNL